jgi:nitric oxide reductase activation protein
MHGNVTTHIHGNQLNYPNNNNNRFKELSDHLREKKEQNKKTLEQKDKKIISLRKKIEEVRKDDDDRRKRFREEMDRQEVIARREHLETESRLLTEYKALLEALDKEGTENFR